MTQPKVYNISPVSVDKRYDGKPLYAENRVIGLSELEKLGYTYEVVITGSQTEPGRSNSVIQSIVIFDVTGKDVTNTFKLNINTGHVHVYLQELYFESDDFEKVYDGQDVDTGYLTGGEFLPGHTYKVISRASRLAGNHLNRFDVIITDENGEDVSSWYKIHKSYGHLHITRAALTIKAGDAEKVYDGTALTCEEILVILGELIGSDYIFAYKVVGSQTEIGRSDNLIVDILIFNEADENVTDCYEIKLECGKLKVTFG